MAEPPKSTIKKGTGGDYAKCMSSKLFLISDWNNVQIASYCDACDISFSESVNDCINHIRLLEKTRYASSKGLAENSSEVHGN